METWLSFQKDAGNEESCLILAKLIMIFDKSILAGHEENQESAVIGRYSMTGKV